MNFKERAAQYRKMISEISVNRKKEAVLVAQDAMALMIDRLQNKGTGSDGKKFPLYSDNELPLFYFEYKNAPSKVKAFKEKVKKGKVKSSYKAFKKQLGLPLDKRTHTLAGDMFSAIRPVIISHDENITVVEIKANDKFNQDKINWNSNLMKISIIGLNKGEKEIITKGQKERLKKIIDKYK